MLENVNTLGPSVLLKVEGLSKHFGGLLATNEVDLTVEEKVVYSIIGPNGAGKTTLFNLIYGVFPPSSGKIYFRKKDITGLRSYKISRLGIGRSFQGYNLFTHLTVFENVRIACQSRGNYSFNLFADVQRYRKSYEKARGVLKNVGLLDVSHRFPYELSHGDQRILEIAVALACDPILLLLDEPTSGLAPEETVQMIDMIKRLKGSYTILLIEHKMTVVMSVSDRIIVLHQGAVIAEGTPEEIKRNEAVNRAYLGVYRDYDVAG